MRSRQPHRSRRSAAVTLTGLVILVSSTSCSTGAVDADPSAPPASTLASTVSSASASSSPVAVPTPTAPAPRRGRAGEEAFARYVMKLWGTSLRADDAGPLLALAPKGGSCAGCRELATELGSRARDGWHVDFPGLLVRSVRVRPGAGGEATATARVGIPASDSYFDDGRFRSSNAAHPRATFTVRMRWTEGGYRLLGFGIA
ncbi:MAG: hypothetical protein ACXVWU_11320 [Nocardioides sp.]